MDRYRIFIAVIVLLIATACGPAADGTPAADALETYLQALADKDEATLSVLSCADWEAQALLELDAFQSVETTLKGLSCEQGQAAGGAVTAVCEGQILASYFGEDQTFDLSERRYTLVEQGGDWLVCGSTTVAPEAAAAESASSQPAVAAQSEPTSEPESPAATETAQRDPADWKSWPVLPTVSDELIALYQQGIQDGNDPHAFSFLGDCLSLPEVFLGPYDSDPAAVAELPAGLQETVAYFAGSFDRYNPAVKSGTTTGALLWGQWNDNEEGLCTEGETPLDCELRVHRPSIVFVHIGTHWETRDYQYLSLIVDAILEHEAIPVLVTKADNRELDERVNEDVAMLAVKYNLPVWNFWETVRELPNAGLAPDSTWDLTEEAQAIHRRSALEALDAIWRAAR